MNKALFTGRLTADPELRHTTTGKAVCSFTLAVKRPFIKETVDFINFVVWSQGAEYLTQYATKGAVVGATGVLTSRKYEDKNGNKRTVHEVVCDEVEVIRSNSHKSEHAYEGGEDFEEFDDEDTLPF